MKIDLIIHNIRSVHNVGSLFRTADAAGVSRIILSGYTPTPIDRFGRARKDFSKVSLGAENTVPWSYTEHIEDALRTLKQENFLIAALEQDPRSTSLFDWQMPHNRPIALIVGNEVGGVEKDILDQADVILEIPMHGQKESLNVSVAGGIALFQIGRVY